jgi:hypothetical protein
MNRIGRRTITRYCAAGWEAKTQPVVCLLPNSRVKLEPPPAGCLRAAAFGV